MEWKETEGGEKIVWKKLLQSRGIFDIDLACEGKAQSQMCVFVIKQVWTYRWKGSSFCAIILFYSLLFHATKQQTSASPSSLQPLHCLDSPDLFSLEKQNVWNYLGTRWSCLGDGLESGSEPMLNSALGLQMPASHIRALPQPFNLLPSCTQTGNNAQVLIHGLLAELWNRLAAALFVLVCSIISLGRQYKSQWMFFCEYLMQ